MVHKTLLLLFFSYFFSNALPAQNSWQQQSNFSAGARQGAFSFSIGDKGYIGTGTDEHDQIRSDFWEYNPQNDTWTQKADYGGGIRYFATAFTIGSKAYAGTGIVASYNWRQDMWEYDPATNIWTQKNDFAGGPRYTAVAFGIGDKGYMGTGNYRPSPFVEAIYLNDFYEYNPATDQWTQKADVPEQGRTNAIGMCIGSKGYIGTGFYYYDTRKNDFWEYDPVQNNWTRKADLPATPRYGATAFSIGNKGYLGGGWFTSALNDFWQFDAHTNTWAQKQSFPGVARYVAAGFTIGSKGYFGLGGNDAGALGDWWQYSPDLYAHNSLLKFDAASVTTVAGNGGIGFGNGNSTSAQFNYPVDVASDAQGNIYVADQQNHAIRKISPQGAVSTIAGTGQPGFANGDGAAAQFFNVSGITTDRLGNIIVADRDNNRIRLINRDGIVRTLAGSGVRGFADGDVSSAQFYAPSDVIADDQGNIYVTDRGNNRIRKISNTGYVTTLAGNGTAGYQDGTGTAASFSYVHHIAIDPEGNLYVTQSEGSLRKITPDGTVSTVLVNGMFGFQTGVAADNTGNIYISLTLDGDHNYINKISPDGTFTLVAGSSLGFADGYGDEAKFYYCTGIALDPKGQLFVADSYSNRIRKISAPIYTLSTTPGMASAAKPVRISGQFLQGNIQFNAPMGFEIAATANGPFQSQLDISITGEQLSSTDFYVRLSAQNNSGNRSGKLLLRSAGAANAELPIAGHIAMPIVRFDHSMVSTVAGATQPGLTNGYGGLARFNMPMDVATDKWGNIYVADMDNHSIRKITTAGIVSTLAGDGTPGLSDGTGAAARFNRPVGITVDRDGNVYVADNGNNLIRRIDPSGLVSTVPANTSPIFSGFNGPRDVALDHSGNIYVTDNLNHRIRKISPTGEVSNFAGSGITGTADGDAAQAQFYYPQRLYFDANDNLFVTESYGPLRKITPEGEVTSIVSEGLSGFQDGITLDEAGDILVSMVIDGDHNYIKRHSNNGADVLVAGSTRGYADGTGANAKFNFVGGICTDSTGTIYVADINNHLIRKIALPNVFFTAQSGEPSLPQAVYFSASDLTGNAILTAPEGFELSFVPDQGYMSAFSIMPDKGEIVAQKIYVRLKASAQSRTFAGYLTLSSAGSQSQSLSLHGTVYTPTLQFDPSTVTTLAGSGENGFENGHAATAKFSSPKNIAIDKSGNTFVADAGNNRIRKISPDGTVSTYAGSGEEGFTDGDALQARFYGPRSIAIDPFGNVYVADAGNHAVRKILASGQVITLAGDGQTGMIDGAGVQARFHNPDALTIDRYGNLFVADNYNHSIRKITPDGVVSTFAGNGEAGTNDGRGSYARFISPNNITIDSCGNLYVTQWYAPLRKITTQGEVTTIHTPANAYDLFQDGLAFDALGNIYLSVIMGNSQNAIYKLSPSGTGVVISAGTLGYKDGSTDSARFYDPAGIAINANGDIVIADAANHRIRTIYRAPLELTAEAGTPSTAALIKISGSKLVGNALVQAPSRLELSLTESGPYSSNLLLAPNNQEIFSLPVYVRTSVNVGKGLFKDTIRMSAAGAYSQELPVQITVADSTGPLIVCPAPQTFCYSSSNVYNIPILSASDPSGIISITYRITGATNRSGTGNNASGTFNSGKNRITWTVTDAAGNSSICRADLWIDPPLSVSIPNVYPLLFWGQSNTLYIGFGASCTRLTAVVSGGTRFIGNNYRYEWSNGASTASINVCPNTPGNHVYSVKITDSLGCVVTASQTIHVVDVRCGPAMNKVLVCLPSSRGNQQLCITPAQAAFALLFGGRLGSCNGNPVTSNNPSSTAKEFSAPALNVYPNPNKGVFTVQFGAAAASEIRVIDLNGKIIFRQPVNKNGNTQTALVNLGNAANGIYLVQLVHQTGITNYKITLQR